MLGELQTKPVLQPASRFNFVLKGACQALFYLVRVCRLKRVLYQVKEICFFFFSAKFGSNIYGLQVYIFTCEQKRRELVSCQLESKEEASVMGRVGAKAPAVLAHDLRRTKGRQETLLLPQSHANLSLVCGLRLNSYLHPHPHSPAGADPGVLMTPWPRRTRSWQCRCFACEK